MTARPGDGVRVEMSKWGGLPHWEYDATLLGRDTHGDWLGVPAGTAMSRPGADYVAPTAQVVLVPAVELPAAARGFVATFHDVGGPVQVYVDITTAPRWDGPVVRAVDLDLDVIRGRHDRVWVDDEDEFAQHRVSLGYPPDVVSDAVASCERVQRLVSDRLAPFDGVAERWLARLLA